MDKKRKEVNKEIRNIISPVEIRAVPEGSDETKTIQGYAAKYNAESQILRDWWGDEFVEVIAEGAFDNAIAKNNIRALYNHNTDHILGTTKNNTLRLRSDSTGLHFEIDLPNTQIGNDLYESVRRGDIEGNSFGFVCINDKLSEIEKDGKKIIKRTLLECDIYEISPTAFPAYEDTEVDCRSLEKFKSVYKSNKKENRSTLIELKYL